MRVTLKDIARELGMNESTVSYALAGKGSIKQETREKVRKTAERLGYVPNQAARQMSTGKGNSVAIVVPNVLAEYGEFCEHAFRILIGRKYQTQILITEFSVERELEIVRGLIGQDIAGAIIVPTLFQEGDALESPAASQLLANRIVTVARNAGHVAPSVNVDYEAIGRGLGERFLRTGRKRVCIAVPHPEPFAINVTGVQRGLHSIMKDACQIHIEPETSFVNTADSLPGANRHYEYQIRTMLSRNGVEVGRHLFRRLFRDPENFPDAVVCPHEVCALGILLEAEKNGVKVPEVFELATCQQGVFSSAAPRKIAAGFVSQERLAVAMTGKLLELLKTGKTTKHELLQPEFDDGETLKQDF